MSSRPRAGETRPPGLNGGHPDRRGHRERITTSPPCTSASTIKKTPLTRIIPAPCGSISLRAQRLSTASGSARAHRLRPAEVRGLVEGRSEQPIPETAAQAVDLAEAGAVARPRPSPSVRWPARSSTASAAPARAHPASASTVETRGTMRLRLRLRGRRPRAVLRMIAMEKTCFDPRTNTTSG